MLAIVAVTIAVAVASALGGYALGRHGHSAGAERQTAVADALEIVGAYNQEPGYNAHLVWVRKAAPRIWRFLVKVNAQNRYGCEQVNLKQFWHGQGTNFHGYGPIDVRQCKPTN